MNRNSRGDDVEGGALAIEVIAVPPTHVRIFAGLHAEVFAGRGELPCRARDIAHTSGGTGVPAGMAPFQTRGEGGSGVEGGEGGRSREESGIDPIGEEGVEDLQDHVHGGRTDSSSQSVRLREVCGKEWE